MFVKFSLNDMASLYIILYTPPPRLYFIHDLFKMKYLCLYCGSSRLALFVSSFDFGSIIVQLLSGTT